MSQHNDKNEYNKTMPVRVAVPRTAGYPNKASKPGSMVIRGAGAATKGKTYNSSCC